MVGEDIGNAARYGHLGPRSSGGHPPTRGHLPLRAAHDGGLRPAKSRSRAYGQPPCLSTGRHTDVTATTTPTRRGGAKPRQDMRCTGLPSTLTLQVVRSDTWAALKVYSTLYHPPFAVSAAPLGTFVLITR